MSNMEITGKIIEVLPLVTGTSAKGLWKKQTCVLETEGQYPKQIAFDVWGDNVDKFALCKSQVVTIGIDIESREYNGKWYTEVRAWQCRKESAMDKLDSKPPPVVEQSQDTEDESDLPF